MARRQSSDPLERYDTREWMVRALLAHVPLAGRTLFEPCAGNGSIASVLQQQAGCTVVAKDIAPRAPWIAKADTLSNAAAWPSAPMGIVTNTPFSRGAELVRLAEQQRVPFVLNLARLTFLERTQDRDDIRDPDFILVLPRIRPWFLGRGSDSATVAWFAWFGADSFDWCPLGLVRLGRAECQGYHALAQGQGYDARATGQVIA